MPEEMTMSNGFLKVIKCKNTFIQIVCFRVLIMDQSWVMGPFILALRCVAVPIYRFLSAATHSGN